MDHRICRLKAAYDAATTTLRRQMRRRPLSPGRTRSASTVSLVRLLLSCVGRIPVVRWTRDGATLFLVLVFLSKQPFGEVVT